jgi:hypothetical protein
MGSLTQKITIKTSETPANNAEPGPSPRLWKKARPNSLRAISNINLREKTAWRRERRDVREHAGNDGPEKIVARQGGGRVRWVRRGYVYKNGLEVEE